jgi:shikimate 5-dehydrogenase
LAFDTIYTPASTKFLQQADAAGIATVNGQQMFLHQAGAQARLWTSQEPNLEAMQAAFDQAG